MEAAPAPVPVITIDGPSGSGKGTISLMLAKELGWHLLDSGAIYRAIAWAVMHYKVSPDDEKGLQNLLDRVQIAIENHPESRDTKVICDDSDITQDIRQEVVGAMASKTSALPIVRAAVLHYQRDFRRSPGLVADGRDMGTVVFPDALLKFFLEANPEERARRRYDQLQNKGIDVSLHDIQEELDERDRRDTGREVSPTKPASDGIVIDTTGMDVDQVFVEIFKHVDQRVST